MVVSVTLGFMPYASVRVFKKADWINGSFFLEGVFCLRICVPNFVCFWVLVCLCVHYRSHKHLYVVAWIFTNIHVFPLSAVGKGWGKGKECEKGRVDEKGVGTELLQPELFLFLLILPHFLIAEGLLDVNMKILFCGELYRVMMMMMIKIKIIIIIMFLFFSFFF